MIAKRGVNANLTLEERFWLKVDKHGSDGCWVWTARRNSGGYGTFRTSPTSMSLAHRYSFELAGNTLIAGLDLDHRCQNRACVNPIHLRQSTRQENQENHHGRARSDSVSGVRNVHWDKQSGKWKVTVQRVHGGYFAREDLDKADTAAHALRNKLYTYNDIDRK